MKRITWLSAKILVASSLMLLGTNSFAVNAKQFEKKMKSYKYSYTFTGAGAAKTAEVSRDEILKLMKNQESKRNVASESSMSEEWFEGQMSAEFRHIRDEFLKINTGEALDNKLAYLDAHFEELKESDTKFFVAQLIPLRSMRGIVWRLKPLVSDVKLTHSLLLTYTKSLVVNAQMYFPTNQTKALIEYMTQPFVANGVAPWANKGEIVEEFSGASSGGEAELQAHFTSVVIPMLMTAAKRVEMTNFGQAWRVFDNRLWYGENTFPDALNRYALVGEVERQVTLANLYGAISELSFQAAYRWSGTLQLNHEISNLYGFDFILSAVDGVPMEKRVDVIRKSKFSDWGQLIDKQLVSGQSWDYLNRAVNTSDLAWEGMKLRKPSELTLYNNSNALPFQRVGNLRMATLKQLLQGSKAVTSTINGNDTIIVDLKSFYANPPRDLKELYPVKGGFKKGGDRLEVLLDTKNGKVKKAYRDYTIGSGERWDVSANSPYRTLFPQVTDGSKDFIRHVRVLSQAWGASAIAVPISSYVQ